MSYQPGYAELRPARHWLDLLLKAGGLLGGVTAAAIMAGHILHKYSPPTANAPIAQIVRYYSKGTGAVGGSGHWTMEASEGSAQWRRAVRYCRARASAQDTGWSGGAPKAPTGCATIQTLAGSGY
ncbi:MAG: hypothetical protein M0Z36_05150 [Thermaerobacter sp.]|nr:hypothetical protein [Thermaerobacter sp.]